MGDQTPSLRNEDFRKLLSTPRPGSATPGGGEGRKPQKPKNKPPKPLKPKKGDEEETEGQKYR
jgi:hypothetical protein